VNGIQVCSNKGPGHLQRGDTHKNEKIRWGHLKFSRTTGPILTRLGTNYSWEKRIHVCSYKWEGNAYLILEKYFYVGQGYSGERCGPWASCCDLS
jgi:hypothetical protein